MSSASLTDSRAAQKEQLDEPKRPQSTAVMIEGGNSTPNGTRKQEYRETTEVVYLKKRFFWATVVASCFAAFAVGLFSRLFILDVTQRDLLQVYHDHVDEHRRIESQRSWQHELSAANTMTLPDPVMKRGKTIPRTTYTSKNFDTTSATTHSRWIVSNVEEEDCFVFPSGPTCTPTPAQISAKEPAQGVDQELIMEEEHLPAGQHLLLDLENIDSQFLNSEERLASAMLELVDQCGLTLLSYHCHKLQPSGVSCAGVLLESHVSFHTWPSRGVITIDLFTCGPNSLLPFVPTVENLFGVASSEAVKKEQQPKMVWAHKYRGFGERSDSAEVTDMFHFPVGQMSDFKEEVSSKNNYLSQQPLSITTVHFLTILFLFNRWCLSKLNTREWMSTMSSVPVCRAWSCTRDPCWMMTPTKHNILISLPLTELFSWMVCSSHGSLAMLPIMVSLIVHIFAGGSHVQNQVSQEALSHCFSP